MIRKRRKRVAIASLLPVNVIVLYILLAPFCFRYPAAGWYIYDCRYGIWGYLRYSSNRNHDGSIIEQTYVWSLAGSLLTVASITAVWMGSAAAYRYATKPHPSFYVCDQCGYNLKSIADHTKLCPECGNTIDRL